MTNRFRRSLLLLLSIDILFAGEAHADTFEFLTYTSPPGWTRQVAPDASVYRRTSGVGLITFFASYPATGSPSDEFSRMWRARVEPGLPGPAPQPQLNREGDYTVAVGNRQIEAPGVTTGVVLVGITGRGRALAVVTIASGDEALREAGAFLSSLTIAGTRAAAPASGSGSAGGIEVDFDVPLGYVSRREGHVIALTPTSVDDKTPCAYGVSPARPSTGALEADARAALLEVLPGWQLKDDRYYAMRGTAGAGWQYFWFRTDVGRLVGGSYEYATAMTMAFPAGPGRTNIVWGVGNPARCLLDDLTFSRLFHSLRPRGWTSDGGKALSRELVGTWRNSERAGVAQYKFMPTGRYEFGIGTVTNIGLLERTSSSVSDGRYELRGSELTITPDRRDRGPTKYRVRIYDEFVLGKWTRAMSLLDENARPALEVEYMRVADSR